MAPINLLNLNSSEFKEFLSTFDHLFSDCDGVILWSKTLLPGSEVFLAHIKRLGKSVHYVSNNSFRDRENYKILFKSANIENGIENLTIPSMAIAEYLKSINFNKKIYCITCVQTIAILKESGFSCKYGPDCGTDYYGDYIQYLEDDEEIGAVVFDSDYKVNLPKLYKARSYLMRPDILFINGATDKYVPLLPGRLELGTGVFTDIVQERVKRTPIQLGKPGKEFGKFAMKRAGVSDASRVLIVGDMIDQDIGLGKATGFKTMLVLTNISEDVMNAHPVKPDYYAPSLGSLVSKLSEI